MADIDVERKSGLGWLWWILGIILIALILWWLFADDEADDDAFLQTPVAEEVGVTEPPAATPPVTTGIPVALILASPAAYIGQTVSGPAQVVEVPTDRGFWIEEGGQRLFVILRDAPAEVPADINPGQSLQIDQATVHEDPADVVGDLDADTRRIAEAEPVFLTVDEANLQVTSAAGAI